MVWDNKREHKGWASGGEREKIFIIIILYDIICMCCFLLSNWHGAPAFSKVENSHCNRVGGTTAGFNAHRALHSCFQQFSLCGSCHNTDNLHSNGGETGNHL